MRASKYVNIDKHKPIEYIWVTNLPNFSINRYTVGSIEERKNGDLVLRLENSPIFGNMVVFKFKGDGEYEIKKSYHLNEQEAAIRLQKHYKAINKEHVSREHLKILKDAKDSEIVYNNIETFMDKYPELTI